MPDQISGLLSPFLRRQRFKAARRYLGAGRVFDIGCGIGNLAQRIPADRYLGMDLDEESIAIARRTYPQHKFLTLTEFERGPRPAPFDTIVGLAVIEHVPDPADWLRQLAELLNPGGCILLTTPHPRYQRLHELGAALRIFSHEGAEEHHALLDHARMHGLADASGLVVEHHRRFLLGANQLFLLRRATVASPRTRASGAITPDDTTPIREPEPAATGAGA